MAGGVTATSFKSAQINASVSPGRPAFNMAGTGSQFNQTASSNFFIEGSLLGNIDNMSMEQLKERLLVSEALMKKLYNRNKDIELFHRQKLEQNRGLHTLTPKLQHREPTPSVGAYGEDEQQVTNTEENNNDNSNLADNQDEEEQDDELEMIRQFKVREEQHMAELQQRQNEIDELKRENQLLIKQGVMMSSKSPRKDK